MRVTTEIPEPLSAVWSQHRSPYPPSPSPLPCLASASGQPVPDPPSLSHLRYLWDILGPPVPSALLVWGFFCCLPTALLATSSALTSLSPVPHGALGAGLRIPGGTGDPAVWLRARSQSLGGQRAPCGRARAGGSGVRGWLLPASPASSKRRRRFSPARPCTPSVPRAPRAPPLAPGQPGIPPLLPGLPKHPLLLLGQNSPAPNGCWALQGLCLIPMTTENGPWGRGAATRPPRHSLEPFSLACPHPAPAWARPRVPEDPAPPRPPPAPASRGGLRPAPLCSQTPPLHQGQGGPWPQGCLTAPPPSTALHLGAAGTSPPAMCTPLPGGPEGSKNWSICDLNYNKQWNKHRAWCPVRGGDTVSPPPAGGSGLELSSPGGERGELC